MVRCMRKLGIVPRKLLYVICAITVVFVLVEISHSNRYSSVHAKSHNKDATPLRRLHSNNGTVPQSEKPPQLQAKVLKVEVIKTNDDPPPEVLQKSRILFHERVPPGYTLRSVQNVVKEDGTAELQRLVFPNVYKNDSLAMQRYINYLQTHEEPLPLQTRAVLILTNYRSGSSFFGELLNQHPDVFYMFEPLIVLSKLDHCYNNKELKKSILKDLFQCKFPDWHQIYSHLPNGIRPPMTKNIFTCLRKKLCFTPFSKDLVKEKHCPRATINVTKPFSAWDHCGAINPNLATNDCRRKKLVAIKVIRLCNLALLEDVVTQIPIDFKVVHLIRDPRGIANSRHVIHRRMNLVESMKFTCKRQRDNSELGLLERPKWLEGRYKMFRYEDAALRPFEVAQELYDYVGLGFPDDVKSWIVENTKHPLPDFMRPTDSADEVMRELSIREQHLMRIRANRDPWGHTRDSKMMVQRWRYRMPFHQTLAIEAACRNVMELAGYLPIDKLTYANASTRYFLDRIPVH